MLQFVYLRIFPIRQSCDLGPVPAYTINTNKQKNLVLTYYITLIDIKRSKTIINHFQFFLYKEKEGYACYATWRQIQIWV